MPQPELLRRHPRPAGEGPGETAGVVETHPPRHLLDRIPRADQQLPRPRLAHLVLDGLQAGAVLLQEAVQAAHRHVQRLGNGHRRLPFSAVTGLQQLLHAVPHQTVTPVRLDDHQQRALEHLVQRLLGTAHRHVEVGRIETDRCLGRPIADRAGKHQRQFGPEGWPLERQRHLVEHDLRIEQPAGDAQQVAQHRHQAEHPHLGSQRPVLVQRDRGPRPPRDGGRRPAARRSRRALHLQADITGQQAVMPTPALQRHPQIGRGQRGPRQHPVAAPAHRLAEDAKRLVVELVHGVSRQALDLSGGDEAARVAQFFWRDLRVGQRVVRTQAAHGIGMQYGMDERHRRGTHRLRVTPVARNGPVLQRGILGLEHVGPHLGHAGAHGQRGKTLMDSPASATRWQDRRDMCKRWQILSILAAQAHATKSVRSTGRRQGDTLTPPTQETPDHERRFRSPQPRPQP